MPVATSPYQNNDYQAASAFRPYNLPVNQIAKASLALDQFWTQGAQRVKSVYDNALGLNLVTEENKHTRDEFMKSAEKQLTKLSSMNLADPSVQRQGISIFNPLLKNKDIVGEDYVVNDLNSELSAGEAGRAKDGGKTYNPLSVENIQYEKNLLAGSNSPLNRKDGWRVLYNMGVSKYTPQADVADEVKKIADMTKASEIRKAIETKDRWGLNEISNKGVSKEKILANIIEMGSPQLKEQMRVEGRNTLYKKLTGDPGSTDQYFQELAKSHFEGKINDLEKNRAELNYQMNMTPKGERDSYKTAIEKLDERIADLQNVQLPKYVGNFTGLGDINNLASSASRVEQLWQSTSMDNLASGLAYSTQTSDIKANTPYIAYQNAEIAAKNLNLKVAEYQEGIREYDQNHTLEWYKATHTKGKVSGDGTDDGSGLSFTNPTGVLNSTLPAQHNESEIQDIGAQERSRNKSGEELTQSFVSNLLGPDAWVSIQSHINDDAPLSEALNMKGEMDELVKIVKAYSDKGLINQNLKNSAGVTIPKMTEDDARRYLSTMKVSDFKILSNKMLSADPEFAIDLMHRFKDEADPKAAVKFRASYNKTITDNINLSRLITDKVKPMLGDYSKFFDEDTSPLTDDGIKKAFEKAKRDPAFNSRFSSQNSYDAIRNRGFEGKMDMMPSTSTSPEYQEKLKFAYFKNMVDSTVNRTYYKARVENNATTKTRIFDHKAPEEASDEVAAIRTMLAKPNGTDLDPDVKDDFDFIQKHADKLLIMQGTTPTGDSDLPTVSFVMQDFASKDDNDTRKRIDRINNKRYEYTGGPEALKQRDDGTGKYRARKAQMIYAPAKMDNGKKSYIDIQNASSDPSTISPRIDIENIYVLKDGYPLNDEGLPKLVITEQQLAKDFQSKMAEQGIKLTLYDAFQTNVDLVNNFITQYLAGFEQMNKDYKNKKDK